MAIPTAYPGTFVVHISTPTPLENFDTQASFAGHIILMQIQVSGSAF
jgi:hypothetical protein